MAEKFTPTQMNLSNINGGNRYEKKGNLSASDFNAIVEGVAYSNATASNANALAINASSAAQTAKQDANNALTVAGSAQDRVDEVGATVSAALTAANNAQSTADNALAEARAATSKADGAFSSASTAEAAASVALEKANNALSKNADGYYEFNADTYIVSTVSTNGKSLRIGYGGVSILKEGYGIIATYADEYIYVNGVYFYFPTDKTENQTFAMLSDVGNKWYLHQVRDKEIGIYYKIISPRSTAYTTVDEIWEDWRNGLIVSFIWTGSNAKVVEFTATNIYIVHGGALITAPPLQGELVDHFNVVQEV